MATNSATGQAIATAPAQRKSAVSQRKFLIGGALIVLAIAYLVYSSMSSSVYYLTPTEAKNNPEALQGMPVQIGGNVVEGPFEYDGTSMTLKFDITDNTTTFPVYYKGIVPDAFEPGVEVVVEGKFNSSGVFEATSLLAKCPSKYVPEVQ